MDKKSNEEKLDLRRLNDIITSSSNILKIAHALLLIIGIYAITLIFEKWGIISFVLSILTILSPFFIGFVIAWLLNPIVIRLQKKGINRILGTVIIYSILLLLLYFFFSAVIPLISTQINDFVSILPNIVDTLKNWIDKIFDRFAAGNNTDISAIKIEAFNLIEAYEKNITTNLPTFAVNFVTGFVSGVGNFVIGLLIGFFMLFDFNTVSLSIIKLVPRSIQRDFKTIITAIDGTLNHFVNGILVLSFLVFIISTIGFYMVGLKAPILLGLICGVTNIIPLLGPYIGGSVAVTVGFVQSTSIGIFTLVIMIIIQMLEGNLMMPLVMSKKMKLHPVTIIISLLVFIHYFGIMGMIISTPVIAIIKILFIFFNDKFKIYNLD